MVSPEVVQKASGQDVGRGEIHLEAAQVAARDAAGAVLAARQAVDQIVAVEGIQAVVEPGAALGDRPGQLQARRPLVDVQAAIGGDAGDEVGAAEAQAVVAHLGFEIQHAGRAPPVLRREAAALDAHGLDGVDVHARVEVAGDRVGDVETVERVIRLVGGAPVEMGAAGVVLHHAVEHRQGVAVVLRRRVGDRLNLRVVEFLALGRLLRIDGRRRVRDVDLVGEFLQMVQRDGDLRRALPDGLGVPLVDVEAEPLGADGVVAGGRQVQAEVARQVGRSRGGRASGHRPHLDARPGYAGSRIVDHAPGDGHLGFETRAQQHRCQKGCPNVRRRKHRPPSLPIQHSWWRARWKGNAFPAYNSASAALWAVRRTSL